jgi:hypothetical protein
VETIFQELCWVSAVEDRCECLNKTLNNSSNDVFEVWYLGYVITKGGNGLDRPTHNS